MLQNATSVQILSTVLFIAALAHTFATPIFNRLAGRYREGSVGENVFHLLGEIEIVFGLWAAIFLLAYCGLETPSSALQFLEARDFKEPAFIFVILVLCSTRPILESASQVMRAISRLVPLPGSAAFYFTALFLGPLLGSLITEPATMTVTALVLYQTFFRDKTPERFKYSTLGVLFVSVSIGGVLTPFAAPPVLMVASKWNWDVVFMLKHFGWKSVSAVFFNALLATLFNLKTLKKNSWEATQGRSAQHQTPLWIIALHHLFLILVVLSAHHLVVFLGVFLFFLGVYAVTQEFQDPLKLREGLLVGFFLGGLVVLGAPQGWWLEPLLSKMDSTTLFLGAAGLTAITDNAALTYLGSQVPGLAESAKYALVAGAVTGGGLTVIANAPNPAGYGILAPAFGKNGIEPLKLFGAAMLPTLIAAVLFWFAPF